MKTTVNRSITKLLFSLFVLLCTNMLFTQNKQIEFWDHVRFGGGVGVGFGDGYFSGTLAPSAIYQFNDQFAAGVGLNGTYASLKNNANALIVGGSVIGLYNVIPEIQLSAEFEELNVSRKYKYLGSPDVNTNYWYPALFLGVGFQSNNFTIGIRYDVLFDKNESIYANAFAPFVRVYF